MTPNIKMTRFAFFCLFLFTIWSCRVGKDYRQPALELPNRFLTESYADTSSIADIEWKKYFIHPQLQQLIERGLTYNHNLLMAINRMQIAQLQLRQADKLHLPKADLLISGQFNRPSDNSINGISAKSFLGKTYIESYSAAASFSWEADIWGKIRWNKEASLANYLQSYEAIKAVQTSLVAGIAKGFINLLMLDRQLDIARKNLVISDSFVYATRLLRNAGVVTTLAVQQAEAQKQATEQLVPQLEQRIALEENALQILTGQLPGKLERSTRLEDIIFPQILSTGMPVAMVSRRPDVRTREMALVAANARVGIAEANLYPALNITLGGGLEAFKASNWFLVPGSLFGMAAGTIVQPLFQRGALKTQVKTAHLEREIAVTEFRQSVLQAVGEVQGALVDWKYLGDQKIQVAAQVDTLITAVSNARLLYKSDMATYLEVLTAQEQVLQAELNLASLQRRQMGAAVELYRALGGGWK